MKTIQKSVYRKNIYCIKYYYWIPSVPAFFVSKAYQLQGLGLAERGWFLVGNQHQLHGKTWDNNHVLSMNMLRKQHEKIYFFERWSVSNFCFIHLKHRICTWNTRDLFLHTDLLVPTLPPKKTTAENPTHRSRNMQGPFVKPWPIVIWSSWIAVAPRYFEHRRGWRWTTY